ncbi:MAG: hypothetical protein JWR54_2605 [Mucilaginibacter sp.]|nr:hypothetical protein [Mucilaginibacter sp.]
MENRVPKLPVEIVKLFDGKNKKSFLFFQLILQPVGETFRTPFWKI